MIDFFFKSLRCFLPYSPIVTVFRGGGVGEGDCSSGHLLSDESMMNSAYTKTTEDDHLYFLFCGFFIRTQYVLSLTYPQMAFAAV